MASTKRIHVISFLVALLVVFLVVAWVLKPFLTIVAFALIVTILFHPVYRWLNRRLRMPAVASLLTVLLMLLIIFLPIWLFGHVIVSELTQLFNRYRAGEFVVNRGEIISSLPVQLQTAIENFSQDLNNFIGRVSGQFFSSLSSIVSNVASFVVSFFVFLFIVYYLLKDGGKIKRVLMDISPIASSQENLLFDKIVAAVNGIVKGSFFVALIQGAVATVGFIIFGIPEPWIWGAFTVVAALVPNVGTALALIPAVLYLLLTGHAPQSIGLAVWGVVAVGLIDNFLGPKLVGNAVKLHPVLVLLAVLGGIKFFGVLGFLIGPIIMAVFVAMVEIYRDEFKDYLSAS